MAVPIAYKYIFMMYIKRVLVQFLLIIWFSDLFNFFLCLKKKKRKFISEPFWFYFFLNEMNSKIFIDREHWHFSH